MSKRYGLLASFILLFTLTAISSAADVTWNNNASDGNWTNASNWTGGVVPNTTSDYARISMATGPLFSSGRSATAFRVFLQGTNGTITINGGTLNTNNHFYVAALSTDTATINMSGGAINMATTFWVARDSGGVANVNLSGGTITCNALNMRLNGGTGTINITSTGKLIINGDATATITPWITNGWIKAYGGAGTVMKDFNITTPGKTTVWASVPTKAGGPSPANSAANVSTLADLSWTGITGATSHDVYFGTASPGTFQTNTASTTYDPGRLSANTTYYWRIDEKIDSNVVSTGDVWTFTTGSNVAANPNPANGAVNVSVTGTLSWTAGVSAASHNVYFGTANPPASIGNQATTTYNPGTLAVDKTYYWRIDEVEDANHIYTGTVWSFSTQGSFKKGPYLIYPGNNAQMIVLWQMSNTLGCTLAWGLDSNCTTGSTATTEYGTDHQHKYTITGLTPGTKYYYKITAGAAQTTSSFRTAPAANATSVKLFAYGDTRTNVGDHSTICAGMNSVIAGDPAFQTLLLHSGDWVESDSESNWTNEYFNRSYPAQLQMEASMPIMGCLGNHETTGTGVTIFDKYWPYTYAGSHYYSFDYGPVHIAVVDHETTSYAAGSAQITWLANDLATSTKKWKIVMFHEPGWCAGGSHPNNATVQAAIQPLCEQYGVQIVFAGHNHYYSRAVVNGVHHVTTGAGGAPFYSASPGLPNIVTYTTNALEFCKVSIDGNSLTCQAVKPDGTVIDQFYVDKEEPDFTFVQATDPQIGWVFSGNNCGGQNMDSKWLETVNGINIVNPAFVVVTGDLTDSKSNSAAIAYYKSSAAQLKPSIPMYNLPGNHDIDDAPSAASYSIWQTNFSSSGTANPWFSFTHGNNLFICLDSMILKNSSAFSPPGKNTEEMNWLTTTLQNASGYDNIMVFMHVPLCMTAINEADGTNNMPLTVRNQLLNLFHTYGVKAVFSGHAHTNSYVRDGDLEIITTSSCLCSLGSPATPQGFRVIKVYPNHIEHEYIPNPVINCITGDFNCDGIVDFKDMGIFTGHWLDGGLWP
jgi:predicted phosphodiesterase